MSCSTVSVVPDAVARALRLIESHPSVVGVRLMSVDKATGVEAVVDVRTELPNAWRGIGQSPSGVRIVEPVTFRFPLTYPLTAPVITLRQDFDRSHPHIQPSARDDLPEPCLIAGSPRELIQTRGILGLVEQLAEWLEKASSLTLNDPHHGWEPVRRDAIDDLVVADAGRIRGLVTPEGGCNAYLTAYLYSDAVAGGIYRVSLNATTVPISERVVGLLERRRFDDGEWVGTSMTLVAWPGKQANGGPIIADQYLPETVTTLASLLERAETYGCRPSLTAKLDLLIRRLRGIRLSHPSPLVITLLPRRPYALVGTPSPIEICAYLVEVSSAEDLASPVTPVRLVGHRDAVSTAVLRRASGDDPSQPRTPWTLIGCGSVGSKLALHLARAGRGPSVLVDRDSLEPHNFARHSALPISADREGLFYRTKTSAVATDLEALGQRPRSYRQDVLALALHPDGQRALAPEGTATIVNTTGSTVVREGLATAPWPDRPRLVEACLLGAGHVAYLTVEGPESNPNASDLAAQAYRIISDDPDLRHVVFSAQAEAIAIGQGCSAVSFPLADAQLSTLTAGMGQVISAAHRDGLPAGAGEVLLGRLDVDGLSQRWQRHSILPWIVVNSTTPGGPSARISPSAHQAIEAAVAQAPGTETGGVIFGRFSTIGNTFQVVGVIPAPPDSMFSTEKFILGTQGLKTHIADLIQRSHGTLYALGTWHNHLVPSGPSPLDMQTAKLLALEQMFPLLMLIHTPDGYTFLTAEALEEKFMRSQAGLAGSASQDFPVQTEGTTNDEP